MVWRNISLLALSACLTTHAVAGTVGLYSFDTLAKNLDEVGYPERFFDSSGNHLDFNASDVWGAATLSSDVPSVAPSGSMSLLYQYRSNLDTPATNLFSIGTTGQLTVEFWYKPLLTDTSRIILAQENGPNAWTLAHKSPPVNGSQSLDLFTNDANGSVDRIQSEDRFLSDANPSWVHLAITFDNTGTVKMYRDGVLEDQASGFGPYAGTTHTLRIGSNNPAGGFAGRFLMDDLRISNVALSPGNGTGVNELAWNASLSQGIPTPPPRSPTFGRDWVRDRPFMINSWGEPYNKQLYRDANFNTALSSRDLGDIAGHFLGSFTELNDDVRTAVQWGKNAGVEAWLVRDEVPFDQIPGTAAVADYIRAADPDALVYVSLGGAGPSYVDDVITGIRPDAFQYGFYPFRGPTNATDWWKWNLDNTEAVRQKSLQYDIPVFAFMQSYEDLHYEEGTLETNARLPSGSELRADLFTKLAAGFKGFTYYLFDLEYATPRHERALVGRDDDPSPLYDHAKVANAEVLRLGQSLRHLESTQWRHISGGVSTPPETIAQWTPNEGSGRIDDIDILGAPAARKDTMVGYFTDDAGKEYFMLVNLWHGMDQSPAALSATFSITFDATINEILRLNRLTGEPEKILLNNHVLTLSLPGGTGDLFKYNNGDFAGIPGGDADLDGDVDLSDLGRLATFYGTTSGARWSKGDFDFDGDVDLVDLGRLATHYGAGAAQAFADFQSLTSIPEPAMSLMNSVAAIILASRRRRAAR